MAKRFIGVRSTSVLLAVLQKSLKICKKGQKRRVINSIYKILVDECLIDQPTIEGMEKDFLGFVKRVVKYIKDQGMEEDTAIKEALKMHPNFRFFMN